jgi:hypothetical protein
MPQLPTPDKRRQELKARNVCGKTLLEWSRESRRDEVTAFLLRRYEAVLGNTPLSCYIVENKRTNCMFCVDQHRYEALKLVDPNAPPRDKSKSAKSPSLARRPDTPEHHSQGTPHSQGNGESSSQGSNLG